jgi:hypothetical protein
MRAQAAGAVLGDSESSPNRVPVFVVNRSSAAEKASASIPIACWYSVIDHYWPCESPPTPGLVRRIVMQLTYGLATARGDPAAMDQATGAPGDPPSFLPQVQ